MSRKNQMCNEEAAKKHSMKAIAVLMMIRLKWIISLTMYRVGLKMIRKMPAMEVFILRKITSRAIES